MIVGIDRIVIILNGINGVEEVVSDVIPVRDDLITHNGEVFLVEETLFNFDNRVAYVGASHSYGRNI